MKTQINEIDLFIEQEKTHNNIFDYDYFENSTKINGKNIDKLTRSIKKDIVKLFKNGDNKV